MSNSSPRRERPYRSHLRPACLPCRKRKSRCKTDSAEPGSACLMCRFHETDCSFPGSSGSTKRTIDRYPCGDQRRRALDQRKSPAAVAGLMRSEPRHQPTLHQQLTIPEASRGIMTRSRCHRESASKDRADAVAPEVPFPTATNPLSLGEGESHIVGPVLSSDARLIAKYVPSGPVHDGRAVRTAASPLAGRPGWQQKNVMFSAVRKHPLGTSATQSEASVKCQIVEKLVEPFCSDLIDLYFEKVHKCFPLLDEASFRNQYVSEKSGISPALLSNLYAHAMIFWKHSPRLSAHHCPDMRFVWNQASDALYSELHLSPGIFTIVAILLNISGRPLTSMIGNGLLLGSAISLAHSLGLNRDCLGWDISPAEKYLRTRIWWAIVIYDRWSSIAYGTPPHLRWAQHDVSLPSAADLYGPGGGDVDREESAIVFISLATLTEILGLYLEHVFCLRRTVDRENSAQVPDIQGQLTEWEDALHRKLRRAILCGVDLGLPGSSNLRLAYLYLKLLSRKLELASDEDGPDGWRQYTRTRGVAEEIVLFVEELDDRALADFWLPLSAFSLSGTTTFLLRCTLERDTCPEHPDRYGLGRTDSLKLAQDLIAALRSHRQTAGWDLGDACIAQFAEVVERLGAPGVDEPNDMLDLENFVASNVPGVEELFPSLWDMFSGAPVT